MLNFFFTFFFFLFLGRLFFLVVWHSLFVGVMSSSGPPPAGQPGPATPTAVRYATRGPKNPTSRAAEAARERTLRRDKDNFSTLRDRSKGHIVNGPYKLRPPVKISTKTIDTDTIGRVNKGMLGIFEKCDRWVLHRLFDTNIIR